VLFWPTPRGKTYLSDDRHRGRGNVHHKNAWSPALPRIEEFAVFCRADEGDWHRAPGYWSFRMENGRLMALGACEERLCHFPRPSNDTDPWHGYPVSPLEDQDDALPDDLVDEWVATGVLTYTWGQRIKDLRV
jgi:hypothetical protein